MDGITRKDDLSLRFYEEQHKYECSDGIRCRSVTKTVESYFCEFVPATVIARMMNSGDWSSSPYFGLTQEQIKKQWKEERDAGTRMHSGIETMIKHCCNSTPLGPKLDTEQLVLISSSPEFYSAIPHWPLSEAHTLELAQEFFYFYTFVLTKPFREFCVSEFRICSAVSGERENPVRTAGTIDLLTYDRNGECTIYDWKRTKQLRTYSNKKGKYPFIDLYDCNSSHYSLQQNLYRHILEDCYTLADNPLTITTMQLIILHSKNEQFLTYSIEREERVSMM